MILFPSTRASRRDNRYRPGGDHLETRVALTADLFPAITLPDIGIYAGPIFTGGDGPAPIIAETDPLVTPCTTI
jgi:hypothetical protein